MIDLVELEITAIPSDMCTNLYPYACKWIWELRVNGVRKDYGATLTRWGARREGKRAWREIKRERARKYKGYVLTLEGGSKS